MIHPASPTPCCPGKHEEDLQWAESLCPCPVPGVKSAVMWGFCSLHCWPKFYNFSTCMENWQLNGCAKGNTVGEKIKIVSLDNHWVLNFKIHLLNLFKNCIECPVRMSICNTWNTHAHIVAQSWWWSEPANWWCKLCTVITVNDR